MNFLLFLQSDAVRARYMLWPCVRVVCLSVRLSQLSVLHQNGYTYYHANYTPRNSLWI